MALSIAQARAIYQRAARHSITRGYVNKPNEANNPHLDYLAWDRGIEALDQALLYEDQLDQSPSLLLQKQYFIALQASVVEAIGQFWYAEHWQDDLGNYSDAYHAFELGVQVELAQILLDSMAAVHGGASMPEP